MKIVFVIVLAVAVGVVGYVALSIVDHLLGIKFPSEGASEIHNAIVAVITALLIFIYSRFFLKT